MATCQDMSSFQRLNRQDQVAAQQGPGQGPGQAPTPPPPIEVTISGTLSLTGSSNVEESQEALRGWGWDRGGGPWARIPCDFSEAARP